MNRRGFFSKAIAVIGVTVAAPLLKLLPEEVNEEHKVLETYWNETKRGPGYYVGVDVAGGDEFTAATLWADGFVDVKNDNLFIPANEVRAFCDWTPETPNIPRYARIQYKPIVVDSSSRDST